MILTYVCDSRGGQEEIGGFQLLVLPHPPLQQGEYGCNGSLVQGGFCNASHKLRYRTLVRMKFILLAKISYSQINLDYTNNQAGMLTHI